MVLFFGGNSIGNLNAVKEILQTIAKYERLQRGHHSDFKIEGLSTGLRNLSIAYAKQKDYQGMFCALKMLSSNEYEATYAQLLNEYFRQENGDQDYDLIIDVIQKKENPSVDDYLQLCLFVVCEEKNDEKCTEVLDRLLEQVKTVAEIKKSFHIHFDVADLFLLMVKNDKKIVKILQVAHTILPVKDLILFYSQIKSADLKTEHWSTLIPILTEFGSSIQNNEQMRSLCLNEVVTLLTEKNNYAEAMRVANLLNGPRVRHHAMENLISKAIMPVQHIEDPQARLDAIQLALNALFSK